MNSTVESLRHSQDPWTSGSSDRGEGAARPSAQEACCGSAWPDALRRKRWLDQQLHTLRPEGSPQAHALVRHLLPRPERRRPAPRSRPVLFVVMPLAQSRPQSPRISRTFEGSRDATWPAANNNGWGRLPMSLGQTWSFRTAGDLSCGCTHRANLPQQLPQRHKRSNHPHGDSASQIPGG